ncbi:MAG: helicase-related protein, partial [Parcubacteria group bacterium]
KSEDNKIYILQNEKWEDWWQWDTSHDIGYLSVRDINVPGVTDEKTRRLKYSQKDILVFMPGMREIKNTINHIGEIPGVEVLPLHGKLSPGERDDALSGQRSPGIKRRVIVSTNAAETSVTVPGVKSVIDSCRQRSVRYNPDTGIVEMGTEFISQDQADQRAGRAGRISAGDCDRLVTEEQFKNLEPHPISEIKKANLSHLILRLKSLGIDPVEFPYIEPPDKERLERGVEELKMLGALDEEESITKTGREMREMMFEPRLARMLVEAKRRDRLESALVLAAFEREGMVFLGPSIKDIDNANGYNPQDKKLNARRQVEATQNVFNRGGSDWLRNLNVFAAAMRKGVVDVAMPSRSPLGEEELKRVRRDYKKWCRDHHLKDQALSHVAYRLKDYARYMRVRLDYDTLSEKLKSASDSDLATVILAGHPDLLYYSDGGGRGMPSYYPLDQSRERSVVNISPGSVAFKQDPSFFVASRIQQGKGTARGRETTRNYADGIQPISLEQMREVLPHLIYESPGTAQYDAVSGQVMREVDFYPKGTTAVNLGRESRLVTGEEAARIFADALARGQVQLEGTELLKRNQEVITTLNDLWIRAGGKI